MKPGGGYGSNRLVSQLAAAAPLPGAPLPASMMPPAAVSSNPHFQPSTVGGSGQPTGQVVMNMAQLDMIGKQKTRDVKPVTELRIVTTETEDVYIRIHSKIPDTFATAEVFGQELVLGNRYKLERASQCAIFTWHGVMVEIQGNTVLEYDATNNIIKDLVNVAGVLQAKRSRCVNFGSAPPRVLVVGANSSGKSTVAQFLTFYALRRGWKPAYVQLDPRGVESTRQLPSLPGCVSALMVDQSCYEFGAEPIHPKVLARRARERQATSAALASVRSMEAASKQASADGQERGSAAGGASGFSGSSAATAAAAAAAAAAASDFGGPKSWELCPMGNCLHYFVGSIDWSANVELYWKAIAQLASAVAVACERTLQGQNEQASGMIVNGPRGATPDLVKEIIRLYDINSVVVLDDDAMYKSLCTSYKVSRSQSKRSGSKNCGALDQDETVDEDMDDPLAMLSTEADDELLDETQDESTESLIGLRNSKLDVSNSSSSSTASDAELELLHKSLSKKPLDVVHLPRCGGAAQVSENRLSVVRKQRLLGYFYGPEKDLTAYTQHIHLWKLQLLVITPTGAIAPRNWTDRFAVNSYLGNPMGLKNSVLSVCLALSKEDVLLSAVSGLVYVKDVTDADDPASCVLHLLCPSNGPLPSAMLVVGNLEELKFSDI